MNVKVFLHSYHENFLFLQFFEDRMVIQKCDPLRTVVENRIKSLADYFGDSCRAGSWTQDPLLDSALSKCSKNYCSSVKLKCFEYYHNFDIPLVLDTTYCKW